MKPDSADPFDPSRLAEYGQDPLDLPPPRHGPRERFLKGPIPWGWIQIATRLHGQALAVGLALWHEAGLTGRRSVTVTLGRLAGVGVSRDTARRAVNALQQAGLVRIDRAPGRALRITLLKADGGR